MAAASYSITLTDPFGKAIAPPLEESLSFSYSRVTNAVTTFNIALPGNFDTTLLRPDNSFQIWRQLPGQRPTLETGTIWLIRKPEVQIQGGSKARVVTAWSANYLLSGRRVLYAAGSAQSSKTGAADNVMKAIVRENCSSSAGDRAYRYLQVAADESRGPSISKAFAWRQVDTVLTELAQLAAEQGTYIAFDVVVARLDPLTLEFRTYIGQRGTDRRFPRSSNSVQIGPEAGNMDDVTITDDYSTEINSVFVGGQETGVNRATAGAQDAVRLNRSIWSQREDFVNASNSGSAVLVNEAQAALRAGRPRVSFSGRLVDTDAVMYGRDWNWGDYLTASADNRVFDCRADAIRVQVVKGEEQREAWLKTD